MWLLHELGDSTHFHGPNFRETVAQFLRDGGMELDSKFWEDAEALSVLRVCKSGYPLSGYPDLSVNFMVAKVLKVHVSLPVPRIICDFE